MENSFLQAIYQNLDDDTSRLLFADWLEEQGQADRAEFIRLECQQTQLEQQAPLFLFHPQADLLLSLYKRSRQLCKQWERYWFSDLYAKFLVTNQMDVKITTERGFPSGLFMPIRPFLPLVPEVFAEFPTLHSLDLNAFETGFREFIKLPLLPRLRHLAVAIDNLTQRQLIALFQVPNLSNLESLALSLDYPMDIDLRFSLQFFDFTKIQTPIPIKQLSLSHAAMQRSSITSLFRAPLLRSVESLDLSGNHACDECLAELDPQHLGNLVSLNLSSNELTWTGLQTLGQTPFYPQLRRLQLSRNRFGAGNQDAFGWPSEPGALQHLSLASCNIPDEILAQILRQTLPTLLSLDISQNPIGSATIAVLAELGPQAPLQVCLLCDCSLERELLEQLGQMQMPALTVLSLNRTVLGTGGLSALCSGPWLQSVRYLQLAKTGLDDRSAALLAQTTVLTQLRTLDLNHHFFSSQGIQQLTHSPTLTNKIYFGD